ncbi:MAG TPA: 2-phosphosulfolactate phosphatase [Lacipirellulaceae bacterium]
MHDRRLDVHPLPNHVAESALVGSTVVVIDLLRASTTICQAIVSGATEVVPFLEIDEARAAAATAPDRDRIVLGGERGGRRIEGFDLGNSPAEYTREAVAGRRVFLTTTNGTRALNHARLARRVVVGAFVNLSAVAESVRSEPRIDILCAGTDGEFTREDLLVAGAMVDAICFSDESVGKQNDAAAEVRLDWRRTCEAARAAGRTVTKHLSVELRDTSGGRNVLSIGMDRDLVDCAQIDKLDIVPELDILAWRIRSA